MNKTKQILFIFLIFFSINSTAQTVGASDNCLKLLGKSYIPDGQDHQLVIMGNRITKLKLIFYPQFKYKLIICNTRHHPIAMKLMDRHGNVCFSNAASHYREEWEFQFADILNGTIELQLIDKTVSEEEVKILVGFKPVNIND